MSRASGLRRSDTGAPNAGDRRTLKRRRHGPARPTAAAQEFRTFSRGTKRQLRQEVRTVKETTERPAELRLPRAAEWWRRRATASSPASTISSCCTTRKSSTIKIDAARERLRDGIRALQQIRKPIRSPGCGSCLHRQACLEHQAAWERRRPGGAPVDGLTQVAAMLGGQRFGHRTYPRIGYEGRYNENVCFQHSPSGRRRARRRRICATRAWTRGGIAVRVRQEGDDPRFGNPVDEFVTSGAITDFVWLSTGCSAAPAPRARGRGCGQSPAPGGAVVMVHAADDEETARVQDSAEGQGDEAGLGSARR